MRTTLVLAALAALLVAAAPATARVKKLEASMSGAKEMPAADPDGSGTAKIRLDAARKKVCFTINVAKIDQVVAAHIHAGGKNVASGPIKVDLIMEPMSGTKFTGCTKHVARKLIRKILRHPRRYYVNVHTMAYPGGAIRGQLHRPS
jgi:Cu/Zn superoxide dismutase